MHCTHVDVIPPTPTIFKLLLSPPPRDICSTANLVAFASTSAISIATICWTSFWFFVFYPIREIQLARHSQYGSRNLAQQRPCNKLTCTATHCPGGGHDLWLASRRQTTPRKKNNKLLEFSLLRWGANETHPQGPVGRENKKQLLPPTTADLLVRSLMIVVEAAMNSRAIFDRPSLVRLSANCQHRKVELLASSFTI